MKLPETTDLWTPEYQARLNDAIEKSLSRMRQKGDIELERTTISGATRQERIILSSPDGTRYAIVVADDGTLSATAA